LSKITFTDSNITPLSDKDAIKAVCEKADVTSIALPENRRYGYSMADRIEVVPDYDVELTDEETALLSELEKFAQDVMGFLNKQNEDWGYEYFYEATDEEGTEGADVPDDAPDVPGDDEQPVAEEPLEDGVSAEETSELEDEEVPVPGIEYYEEKPEDDTDKKDFDVNDAFDPDLLTPKYDVTELVEPPVSDEAQEKANMVNASLLSIASKGNQMDSFDLTRVIREQRAGQLNIETHDEVTNY
jgi:hypothetical protein